MRRTQHCLPFLFAAAMTLAACHAAFALEVPAYKANRIIEILAEPSNSKPPVITTLTISPDGATLAAAGDDHLIRFWNLEDGKLTRTLAGHIDWIRSLEFSPDGMSLVSGGDDRKVRIWDATTGKQTRAMAEHDVAIFAVQFSPDGKTVAASGFQREIKIYDVQTGALKKTIAGPVADLRSLGFNDDGAQLAVGGRNGKIQITNLTDGSQKIIDAHQQRIRCLAFSSTDGQLASAGEDQMIHIFHLKKEPAPLTFNCDGAKIMTLTYCGKNKLATGGSDNIVHIWDVAGKSEDCRLIGHTGTVASLACTPDGTVLVSGSFDTSIRIWKLQRDANGRTTQRLDGAIVR